MAIRIANILCIELHPPEHPRNQNITFFKFGKFFFGFYCTTIPCVFFFQPYERTSHFIYTLPITLELNLCWMEWKMIFKIEQKKKTEESISEWKGLNAHCAHDGNFNSNFSTKYGIDILPYTPDRYLALVRCAKSMCSLPFLFFIPWFSCQYNHISGIKKYIEWIQQAARDSFSFSAFQLLTVFFCGGGSSFCSLSIESSSINQSEYIWLNKQSIY